LLRSNFGQIIQTYVPLSPSSIIWYWPIRSVVSMAGKVMGLWVADWRPGTWTSCGALTLDLRVCYYLCLYFAISDSL